MTNQNRPVYRYPPKSHAPECNCYRCAQCRSRRTGGNGLIAFDMGCLGVLLLIAAISAVCGWIVKNSHAILHNLPFIAAPPAILAVTIWSVVYLNRRSLRPPEGRLHVEAGPRSLPSSLPVSPPPPPCPHLNAVKVDSSYYKALSRTVIWCCWCPDCESELPASFRRPCCGTEPEARHLASCPHSSERLDITGQWQP